MENDNEPGDVAFVAGRRDDTAGARREQPAVFEAISILLDWRKRGSFRCTVSVGYVDESIDYELTARPMVQSYSVTDVASGDIYAYDAYTGMLREGKDERPLAPNSISTEPMAARLAFPLSLGIWGRSGDSYRITGAVRDEGNIVVALEHQQDSSLLGSLTIDVRRRMAFRLDTPTLSLRYRDIQPVDDRI